ncbi:MAG: class I SAM-dependent methyltransferase [Polyangiaceae bacterium]
MQAGAWDQALALCEAFPELRAPGLSLCRAVARFVSGDVAAGIALCDAVLAEQPEQLSALGVKAQMLSRSGSGRLALPLLAQLIERCPDYPGAHGLLAALCFPGPHYRERLSELHARLRPRCYLEIGVDTGATLALAERSELAVGVDPAEIRARQPLPACARVYREESDAFFASHTREQVLGARRLDLIFIDGMHRFENALSDFINAEAWAHSAATIVFHDCMPLLPSTATRDRQSSFWVGDTWKVVLALATARPDLRIRSLACAPSGLVIVRHLDPNSTSLRQNYARLVKQFSSLTWQRSLAEFPRNFRWFPTMRAASKTRSVDTLTGYSCMFLSATFTSWRKSK